MHGTRLSPYNLSFVSQTGETEYFYNNRLFTRHLFVHHYRLKSWRLTKHSMTDTQQQHPEIFKTRKQNLTSVSNKIRQGHHDTCRIFNSIVYNSWLFHHYTTHSQESTMFHRHCTGKKAFTPPHPDRFPHWRRIFSIYN